jgi:hypothetical protein
LKSYLVNWLAGQHQETSIEDFARDLPGPWLVWEAGPWRPPPPDRATVVTPGPRSRNSSADALAIEVSPRIGRARFEGVRLGRGTENDLVVDDGTLSRAHLLFRPGDETWTLEDLRSSNGTRVDGEPVGPKAVPLQSGSRIEAGSVRMTFYDARGLYLRLKRGVV